MKDDYNINFTYNEAQNLLEALAELRKYIVNEYQHQGKLKFREALQDSLFVAACKLQLKMAKIIDPNTNVTLQDYLNIGNDGLSS